MFALRFSCAVARIGGGIPFCAALLLAVCAPHALAQVADGDEQPPRPEAITAYEKCAVRVFTYSADVGDLLRECAAEMDAHTAYLNCRLARRLAGERRECICTYMTK